MKQYFAKKPLLNRAIIIAALAVSIYLLLVFAGHPQAVERYYSQGLYPVICQVLHPVLNIIPFSLGDLLYISVIGWIIYGIINLIRLLFKKQLKSAVLILLRGIIGVQVGMLLFYVFWGMNYFRPSAAERLNLKEKKFTLQELQTVTSSLIDSANATRSRLSAAEMHQPNDTIYNRAIKAMLALGSTSVNFKNYNPNIKPSLLTPLMNYISTSGYYNPFTTEAQLNYQQPAFARPFVACHEMSHQAGYGPEDEANFAGFLAATASKDKLLRYSAYHLAVGEFMVTMRGADTVLHKELKARISAVVKADFKEERLYWQGYQNELNVVTGIFYDSFLKANNQPRGLDTYNRMVTLVMAMYRERKGL